MRLTYFINQYPKVSHSFIRREILALERQGFEVQRIALRGWNGELADTEDLRERERTQYVLQSGLMSLISIALLYALQSPLRFFAALVLALRMSHHADRAWPYHLIYLAEACRLLNWMRAFQSTHLHAHFGTNSATVAMLAHALGGPPYSFTVHGPEEFDKPQFIKLGEKIRRSSFVVAISAYGRSQLLRWVTHDEWSKVQVVHCGLERGFYDVSSSPLPLTSRLVCVGRLCEQKGQLLLIQAARQLADQNIKFELVLAGDGEMRGAIESLIRDYALEKFVRITGWISNAQVRDEILAARGMVLPSFAEGLPVVIMEAMALRRPVLTTFVAGIPELVRSGESGWLFPAGSVDALAETMREFLATPLTVLKRMGDAGYERVLERHAIDMEVAKLASLFRTTHAGASV